MGLFMNIHWMRQRGTYGSLDSCESSTLLPQAASARKHEEAQKRRCWYRVFSFQGTVLLCVVSPDNTAPYD
jgi:hypothetical protein